MDWYEHENYPSAYDQRLQRFTENKSAQRQQAKAAGVCTRCVVRRARPGKAYCQRCTDYAKLHARKRNRGDSTVEPYRDKVTRIADYCLPSVSAQLEQPQRHRHAVAASEDDYRDLVDNPVSTPQPHRYEAPTRGRPSGAAVPLRSPLPIPVGSCFGDLDDD